MSYDNYELTPFQHLCLAEEQLTDAEQALEPGRRVPGAGALVRSDFLIRLAHGHIALAEAQMREQGGSA